MIDLSDTTFIIPVRIESNDRFRNLILSVSYLIKNTNAKIIVMESDKEKNVPVAISKIIKENSKYSDRLSYIFEFTDKDTFHRTKILNHMLLESNTPIVVNYDCDVILPLGSYQQAAEMCRKEYDLVYPFSFGENAQLRVVLSSNDFMSFLNSFDLKTLNGFSWRAEYGFCQFFKRKSYIDGFMENENFLAYGPEDAERFFRWQKLGYKIGRVNDLIYHFEHSRTPNSDSSNPFMKTNEELFYKLRTMDKEQFVTYYKGQEYFLNNMKKL